MAVAVESICGDGVIASAGQRIRRNGVHACDGPEAAVCEIDLWFQPSEGSDGMPVDQGCRDQG